MRLRNLLDYFIISRSGLFDAYFYLKNYVDVRHADHDPLMHFVAYGWRENRKPSALFNTKYYLDMNPDVAQAGGNPLVHYIRHGKKEGRGILPPEHYSNPYEVEAGNFSPKVSIIVPNFNHEAYLEQRLESIYNQTYKNFEVLLLDDCSTDNSLSIIDTYFQRYPELTRVIKNEINSGSPFSQWKKGIKLAEGDLIWIAESDDYCDLNLLETLVPYFLDESILLAYAHTTFVDRSGHRHPFAFEHYVSAVDQAKWNVSYIETAHNEVNSALGILNSIPNVSGVLFRKIDDQFPLFRDDEWEKMRVCGDWIFYLHLICGGRIAYSRATDSYFRIHQTSTSKQTQTQDIYYKEHEKVGLTIASLYQVPDKLIRRFHDRLWEFYQSNVKNGNQERFSECFNLEKILQCMKNRKPNILMSIYGFSIGGGEILGIRLADAMKENGASVTLFNGGYEPTQAGVRKLLPASIPVIHNHQNLDFQNMLRDFGIEIVHTHHATMENLFAQHRNKFPAGTLHVATMHGMYEMMGQQFLANTREIRKSIDHWLYVADKNILPFKKYGFYLEDKFTKIDNGMRIPLARKIDLSPLGIASNSFIICLASRALQEKGWLEAIDGVQKSRLATNADIHLLLIGEGPVYTQLRTQALPEYIHLLGYMSNVNDYLASSQLGLIPSTFKGESSPLFLIECFMAEIPVVATNIGEIKGMLINEDQMMGGILLELHDGRVNTVELAAAIERFVMDQELYNQCVATARLLKKRFDIRDVAGRYLAAYQHILARNS